MEANTQNLLEKLEGLLKKCDLEQVKIEINSIPDEIKDKPEVTDKLESINLKVKELDEKRQIFFNKLDAYFINDKLNQQLNDLIITRKKNITLIKEKYAKLYLLKLRKRAKPEVLNHIIENTICSLLYFFFCNNVSNFLEEYSTLQLKSDDKVGDLWEKISRKGRGGLYYGVSEKGRELMKDKLSTFKIRRDASERPSKLVSASDINEEVYCHKDKFWYAHKNQQIRPNSLDSSLIFGYIGPEALKTLSQQLPGDNSPNLYPVRSFCGSKTSDNYISQFINSINYLTNTKRDIYPQLKTEKYNNITELSNLVETVQSEIKINIKLIYADLPCQEIGNLLKRNNYPKSKTSDTIFLFVFSNSVEIIFVEPIVFLVIPDDSEETLMLNQKKKLYNPISILKDENLIVSNLNRNLPECDEIKTTPVLDDVTDSPKLKIDIAITPTKNVDDISSKITETSLQSEIDLQPKTITYNLSDLGQELPIVIVGIEQKNEFLLGSEYSQNTQKFRNLYNLEFPYKLEGQLSGDVLSGEVKISWVVDNDKSLDVSSSSIQGGGSKTIYDCLSQNNSLNRTPFFEILEKSFR